MGGSKPQVLGSRMIKFVLMSVSHYQNFSKREIILCKSTTVFFRLKEPMPAFD